MDHAARGSGFDARATLRRVARGRGGLGEQVFRDNDHYRPGGGLGAPGRATAEGVDLPTIDLARSRREGLIPRGGEWVAVPSHAAAAGTKPDARSMRGPLGGSDRVGAGRQSYALKPADLGPLVGGVGRMVDGWVVFWDWARKAAGVLTPLRASFVGYVLVLGVLLGGSAGLRGDIPRVAPAKRVGALTDNYPFSYRTETGEMDGFAYELTTEIARVMGWRVERVAATNLEVTQAFAEGRLDFLQSMAQFPEREPLYDFSVPYLTLTGAVFVRSGASPEIRELADLAGKRVMVHKGSLGEVWLRKAGLGASIVEVSSVDEAFRKLEAGEGDATLATRLTGLALVHHLKARRVEVLDLPVEGYEVRYCLAVREGDRETLAKINEGLAVLVRTGRFDQIYRKWFGHVELVGYTATQVMLAVAVGLALALIVSLWAVVRLRRLQARIVRQTEELRISEERHRAVFNGAQAGLLVVVPVPDAVDFHVEQINPCALELLGLKQAPREGTRLAVLLAAEGELLRRMHATATQRETAEFEHERAERIGWWRVAVSPLGVRTLISLSDITEATRARERLRRQDAQLLHAQKLEAIGTLAGGVAHDFNNLLTSIMGNTELTLMELAPERAEAENLRQVMHAARRARQLVQHILTFSRQHDAKREVLSVSPLIAETIEFLRSFARGTVEFEFRRGPDLPDIVADQAQIHQVLMNIGTNAVQAMRGMAGRLTFTEEVIEVGEEQRAMHALLPPGTYVRIGVHDTGPGMTPAVQARIFEPFFTTKSPGEGTGLGLSVVHGIVQSHGGAITVFSQPGIGTRFFLYFPATMTPRAVPAGGEVREWPRGNGERVLIVDDDPAIVKTVLRILLKLGYRVSSHTRAAEAYAEFAAQPDGFAVVISDLAMPESSGLQLAARIRALRPEQPILLASGFYSDAEELEAMNLRVTRLLQKPIAVAALAEALAACVRPSAVT